MTKMTFSEYAKHRGVSAPAVTQAIQKGRIVAHVDENGRRYLLAEEADEQWMQRTDSERGVPAQQRARAEEAEEATQPRAQQPAADNPNIPPLYQSKAIKEAFFARAAKLKYETDMGKLVPAEEVQRRWLSIVSLARTKILGIPSKTRQRSPEMTNEQYAILEDVVRESLEELADGSA